jgi:hypothetical protein
MSTPDNKTLSSLVLDRLSASTSRQVAAIGGTVMAQAAQNAGSSIEKSIAAALAYGSCLRDVSPEEGLADFYVLFDDTVPVSSNPASRLGCRLFPPNVYYAECEHEGKILRAKYAILPLSIFEQRVSENTVNPYIWARFSQPSTLIHIKDDNSRSRVAAAVEIAIRTMLTNALALCPPDPSPTDIWVTALQATYGTELRPEDSTRAHTIVESDPEWYLATANAVFGNNLAAHVKKLSNREWAKTRASWKRRRSSGKALSIARLIKAGFTFSGGADYLAWKIERHSGVPVTLTPWQRRHPILASAWLYPKLKMKGAFK